MWLPADPSSSSLAARKGLDRRAMSLVCKSAASPCLALHARANSAAVTRMSYTISHQCACRLFAIWLYPCLTSKRAACLVSGLSGAKAGWEAVLRRNSLIQGLQGRQSGQHDSWLQEGAAGLSGRGFAARR